MVNIFICTIHDSLELSKRAEREDPMKLSKSHLGKTYYFGTLYTVMVIAYWRRYKWFLTSWSFSPPPRSLTSFAGITRVQKKVLLSLLNFRLQGCYFLFILKSNTQATIFTCLFDNTYLLWLINLINKFSFKSQNWINF